ncbi:MAG: LLM class flavin-dependent oxidoreductase [Pseudomonadota bacterium]
MRLGALLPPILDGGDSRIVSHQVNELVDAGYESLWMAQAVGRGFMITDPLIALTAAAVITQARRDAQQVELGTAVIQLPLYQPMDLAHRIFSLLQIAGPRLVLGVGAGSTETDFNAFERDYTSRFQTFNEALAALREIFATGGMSGAQLSPWASLDREVPIFYGTWGKRVQRAAEEFDGWIASGHYRTVDEVCGALTEYRKAGGGRAIVSTLQVGADTDLGEFKEKLQTFAQAGFDDAVVMLLPGGPTPDAVHKLIH